MFLKLMVADLLIHRQALRTMQVLKFGEINPMITKAIYGHLDAFYMS